MQIPWRQVQGLNLGSRGAQLHVGLVSQREKRQTAAASSMTPSPHRKFKSPLSGCKSEKLLTQGKAQRKEIKYRPNKILMNREFRKAMNKQKRRAIEDSKARGDAPSMETPPVDEDNEEIVLFFRTPEKPSWVPFTIMKGGTTLNLLVQAAKRLPVGGERIKNTIRSNVGGAIYRDQENMLDEIKNNRSNQGYKYAETFQWGFKIRDKEVAEDWYKSEEIIIIPPKDKIPKGALAQAQDFFSNFTNRKDD